MNTHTLTLSGDFPEGVSISGPLLLDVLALLVEGMKRALRLRVEGRSAAQGRDPGWLQDAAYFELSRIVEGSRELVVSAVPFSEGLQGSLIPMGVDPDATAFDLLAQSLDMTRLQHLMSEPPTTLEPPTDAALLKTLTPILRRIFSVGCVRSIRFATLAPDHAPSASLTLDAASVDVLESLASTLPASFTSPMSLRGRLVSLHAETGAFSLKTPEQGEVRGFLLKEQLANALPLYNQDVYVQAEACFLPRAAANRGARRVKVLNDATLWADPISAQLSQLRALGAGWQGDGRGLPYDPAWLGRIQGVIEQLVDHHHLRAPYIYGTPSDDVQVEWDLKVGEAEWGVEVLFKHDTQAVEVFAVQTNAQPSPEGDFPCRDEALSLDHPQLAQRIADFVSQLREGDTQ